MDAFDLPHFDMIEELRIQDFQAHKKRRIIFDDGVTTIVGPSDVGKSAIIRALAWVSSNSIMGAAFIREGAKQATVELKVDGQKITRVRGKSTNTYQLDDEDFKAFGNGVPASISELMQLDSVNFQGQHDSPFWFAETAGEVSRQLNRVINLEIIDDALAHAGQVYRNARSTFDMVAKRRGDAKAALSELDFVPQMESGLRSLEDQ